MMKHLSPSLAVRHAEQLSKHSDRPDRHRPRHGTGTGTGAGTTRLAVAVAALLLAGCGQVGAFGNIGALTQRGKGDSIGQTQSGSENQRPPVPAPSKGTAFGDLSSVESYQWLTQPRPVQVGDYVVLDNPQERWEVYQIIGRQIFWAADSGLTKVTDYNPILPAYEWRNGNDVQLRRLLHRFEGRLFPVSSGATARFSSTTNASQPPFAFESTWTCSALGVQSGKAYRLGSTHNVAIYECAQGAVVSIRMEYGLEEGRVIAIEQLTDTTTVNSGSDLQQSLAASRREEIEFGNVYGLPPLEPSVIRPGADQKDSRFGRLTANPTGAYGPESQNSIEPSEDEAAVQKDLGAF